MTQGVRGHHHVVQGEKRVVLEEAEQEAPFLRCRFHEEPVTLDDGPEGEYITDLSNKLSSATHLLSPVQLILESGDYLFVEAELSPIDDIRADAAYRSTAAVELVSRTLSA